MWLRTVIPDCLPLDRLVYIFENVLYIFSAITLPEDSGSKIQGCRPLACIAEFLPFDIESGHLEFKKIRIKRSPHFLIFIPAEIGQDRKFRICFFPGNRYMAICSYFLHAHLFDVIDIRNGFIIWC